MKNFFTILRKTAFLVAKRGFLNKKFFSMRKNFFICGEKDKKPCDSPPKIPILTTSKCGGFYFFIPHILFVSLSHIIKLLI